MALANEGTCDVSQPMMPTRIGWGVSSAVALVVIIVDMAKHRARNEDERCMVCLGRKGRWGIAVLLCQKCRCNPVEGAVDCNSYDKLSQYIASVRPLGFIASPESPTPLSNREVLASPLVARP